MSGTATRRVTWILLAALPLIVGWASLGYGPSGWIAPDPRVLLGIDAPSTASEIVMLELRLPRTLIAMMIGAVLGACGAALQGLTRNPLAEPSTLGASSTAALGAVTAIYFGHAGVLDGPAPAAAGLAGAAIGLALVLALGRGGGLSLILAGVGVGALATAFVSLALTFAPSPYATLEMVDWLIGSVADRTLADAGLLAPFAAVSLLLLTGCGAGLDALGLGERTARSMGVRLGRLRLQVVAATAIGVGSATAVAGGIGFVGLIVPHALRPFVGHRPGRLVPASMAGGAVLLPLADLAGRLIGDGTEIRVGVATALIGAPVFLHILLTRARAERGSW
ncbi:iron ABC transporter permease [Tistrella mobilis]|uniref:ABC transporter permease n=1 Tax=Tistrella mobilis TaxID=171437 RepID=A0A162LYH0_9PROT|nr:iron ABC transporter permease [Tistrella mobilis]KYO57572.1 ABC transporter permease [Tistrella mobilis]